MTGATSKKKGFTLIEILVVLGIIGVIVLIGLSSYGVARKKIQLDIAANTIESVIIEAREKSRSGFFDAGASTDPLAVVTLCFGFKVKDDAFIELLSSKYLRLEERCDETTTETIASPDRPETIVIKDLGGEYSAFFVPPYSDVVGSGGSLSNYELKILVGYEDSDPLEKPLDHREIVFDTLSGNVYSQKYEASSP